MILLEPRGVQSGLQHINEIDLNDIQCYMMNGQSGAEMIDLVKQASKTHTLLVFSIPRSRWRA